MCKTTDAIFEMEYEQSRPYDNCEPRLRGLPLKLATPGCSSTHSNALHVLQRTVLVTVLPKAGPGYTNM